MCTCGVFRLLGFFLSLSVISGLRCPLYWWRHGDSCYRFRWNHAFSWSDSEAWCQSQNSHLIKFETTAELNWTFQAIPKASHNSQIKFWTGLNNNSTGRVYTWADNSPVDPALLQGQQVSLSAGMSCGILIPNNNKLTSVSCSTRAGAICERHVGIPLTCNADAGWQSFNNFCYKVYGSNGATWAAAQQQCDQGGGNLFTVESSREEDVIQEFVYQNQKDFWIGVKSYPKPGSSYIWLLAKNNVTLSPRLTYWDTPPVLNSSQFNNTCAYVKYVSSKYMSDIGWSTDVCDSKKSYVCKMAEGVCQPGWLAHQNRCFQFVTQLKLSWQDADQYCKKQGGAMIGIYGLTATKFVNSYLEQFNSIQIDSIWIGATDNNTGNFTWDYGQQIKFNNWAPNEPTNTPGQDCVFINTDDKNGTWRATPNCGLKKAFICNIGFDRPVFPVPTPQPTYTCDDRWVLRSGRCFQFNDTRKSWRAARESCQSQDGDLATVDNADIHSLIINTIDANDNQYWIGLNDLTENKNYIWIQSGARLSGFKNWCPNEPNDFMGSESCVQYFMSTKCWNDRECSAKLKYICQKDPQHIPIQPKVTTTSLPISAKCGVGWEERPNSPFCYSFRPDLLSWLDARAVCISLGGELASVHDFSESTYIQGRLTAFVSNWALWLGGTDLTNEGGWAWSDGTPLQLVNWEAGEPNGQRRENCMETSTAGRGWNDNDCNKRNGFICKKTYGTISTQPPRPTPRVPAGQYLGCPDLWLRHGNSCWQFVKNKMLTAHEAKLACQKSGGYLAAVNSADKQAFVSGYLPRPKRNTNSGIVNGGASWIGLSDRLQSNLFAWDDGRAVKYTNWAVHQPDTYKKDCVGMSYLDGGWVNLDCNGRLPGYICRSGLQVVSSTGGSSITQGCTKPNRGYGFEGSCYNFITNRQTWQSAQTTCKSRNGQLATVNNRHVQSFLASYIDTYTDPFWIGMTDQTSPGTYTWVQGQPISFTFWSRDHTGNEQSTCVVMRTSSPMGVWDNKMCNESHNFICETSRNGFTNAPTTTHAISPCPNGWSSFATFCYKKFQDRLTWIQARDSCRDKGGDLVSILSQAESDFIKTSIMQSSRVNIWLGFNDFDIEGAWVWSDKSPVTFTNWNKNEPNNYNNEDCAFQTAYNMKWVDSRCYAKFMYVCKALMGVTVAPKTTPPVGITATACGNENEWIFYNGACYMSSPQTGRNHTLNWYDARKYCLGFNADLASILTTQENNFVYSLTSKSGTEEMWIGLNEIEVPGKFRWTNNDQVDFINWHQNEPNDEFGAERCVAIKAYDGHWMDDNCNMKMSFVCKKTVGAAPPTSPAPPVTSGGCDDPSFIPSDFSNKCFYISKNQPMTWNQSVQYCKTHFQKPHDLASISNEMEQAFLLSLIQRVNTRLWIGLNSLRFHRRYVWEDNTQITYTNWAKGEPNSRMQLINGVYVNMEPCVEMYTQGALAGLWNDINCNELRNVICVGKKVPNTPDNYTPSTGSCAKQEYTPRGTSCYKFIGSPEATWQQAQSICQKDGAVLASINDVYENAYIEANIGKDVQFWVGLKYNRATSTFNWQRSWPITFTNWAIGEPSNGPSDLCVTTRNGKWDNTVCNKMHGYVCEINSATVPPPTPTPLGHCKNSDDTLFGDFCYYFNIFTFADWPSARYICNKRGMDLVSVSGVYEHQYIYTVASNARDSKGQRLSRNIWLGLNKGLSSGFQWTDSSALSFFNWDVGEPSDPINSTTEECVEMHRDNGKWNDLNCFSKNAFVCKVQAALPSSATPRTFPTIKTQTPPSQGKVTYAPQTTPRVQPSPNKGITFKQQTGFINGPSGKLPDKRKDKKHGLYGGSLAAVIVIVIVILGVGSLIGILYWRKRNPAARTYGIGGISGLDNALYNKENEEVDIDGTSA